MALQASWTNSALFLRWIVAVSLCKQWLGAPGFVRCGSTPSLSPPSQALSPLAWHAGAASEWEPPLWHRDRAAPPQDCSCRLPAPPAENPKQTTGQDQPWNHTGSRRRRFLTHKERCVCRQNLTDGCATPCSPHLCSGQHTYPHLILTAVLSKTRGSSV